MTITDKNLSTPVTRQLTHYSDSAGMIVGNPYIVKATDEVSYLLWAEGTDEDNTWMRVARINNNTGNMEYCSKKIFGTFI